MSFPGDGYKLECFVNLAEEMDAKDDELRETIKTLWPIQGSAMAFILVPPKEGSDTAAAAAAVDDYESALFTYLFISEFPVMGKS